MQFSLERYNSKIEPVLLAQYKELGLKVKCHFTRVRIWNASKHRMELVGRRTYTIGLDE